jgi:hypothetical protein
VHTNAGMPMGVTVGSSIRGCQTTEKNR